jgi:hypothetical protein
MRNRPVSITVLAAVLLLVGAVTFVFHLSEFSLQQESIYDLAVTLLVCVLAAVSGAFLLRASNWARWLAVIWMAFHTAFSALDSWQKAAAHGALLAILAYVLFRPAAQAYFAGKQTPAS